MRYCVVDTRNGPLGHGTIVSVHLTEENARRALEKRRARILRNSPGAAVWLMYTVRQCVGVPKVGSFIK